MTDIVELLRAMARAEHDDLSVADEAADELQRLRAEIERLRASHQRLVEALERAITYIELTYDETDGEESIAAADDLNLARAALAQAKP